MADSVTICNKALVFLGQDTISTLVDDNKRARVCSTVYDDCLEEFLSEGDWSFAKKLATLTAETTSPNHDYSYAFEFPDDFVRLVKDREKAVYGSDDWLVIGDQIHCNDSSIYICYIYSNDDLNTWTAKARSALSYLVASQVGVALTGEDSRARMAYELYQKTLQDALSDDASGAGYQVNEYHTYIEERK